MIDEEIRDALDVDPSPEFLARVRTRIAAEPAPSAWRWSWTIAASGALAAAAIVAILLTPAREKAVGQVTQTAERDRRGSVVPQTGSVRSATERRPDTASDASQPGSSASARSEGPRAPARLAEAPRGRSRSGPGESIGASPEILLDPAETHALHQLIVGVRDGRLDLTAAQKSSSPVPMDLEPIADIVIAPITIEPIAPPSGAEGVRP